MQCNNFDIIISKIEVYLTITKINKSDEKWNLPNAFWLKKLPM